MSEDIRKMIDKVKNFKQLVNENTQSKKYYGVFNIHGEYNNGSPLFLITPTKEEMIYKLNYLLVIHNTTFVFQLKFCVKNFLKIPYIIYSSGSILV